MRLSEFWERMEGLFGAAYASSVAADQVLATLDGQTVQQALAAGEPAKKVWRCVCQSFDVPAHLR